MLDRSRTTRGMLLGLAGVLMFSLTLPLTRLGGSQYSTVGPLVELARPSPRAE